MKDLFSQPLGMPWTGSPQLSAPYGLRSAEESPSSKVTQPSWKGGWHLENCDLAVWENPSPNFSSQPRWVSRDILDWQLPMGVAQVSVWSPYNSTSPSVQSCFPFTVVDPRRIPLISTEMSVPYPRHSSSATYVNIWFVHPLNKYAVLTCS